MVKKVPHKPTNDRRYFYDLCLGLFFCTLFLCDTSKKRYIRAASVQLFNSLLPEQGLPFWVVGFCFFWTLWNNLFAEFDTKKLLRSLGALFALAFVVKYLVLANLTAPSSGGWIQRIFENPGKEAFTWLLDLPRYAAATGYVQFLALALYLIGLFLTPPSVNGED